jgi:hypothetical protein
MTGERTCFMHVPKCGGNSVRDMLEAALPSGSLAFRRTEPSNFCAFDDFDRLHPKARASIAATDAEIRGLAEYPAICGHFSLRTLDGLVPRSRIATVLREPRARVISQYLYQRFAVFLRTRWAAYDFHTPAEGTLAEFLSEPRVATVTDNKICRMLMHGDARIRDARFIDGDELPSIAEAAWERLEDLGFAGILELPGETWRGVGELFGVELRPAYRNVTGRDQVQPGMLPVPPFGGTETLQLLERRSAADAILYERLASRFCGGEEGARELAGAAFAEQLVRFGSFTSSAAPELEAERRAHAQTREQLDTLVRSRSWRLTSPLRRVRQATRRSRGAAP